MTDSITPSEPQRVAPPAQKAVKAGWYADATTGRMRWWDGVAWTDTYGAPVPMAGPKRTNHALHIILSILTVGLWIPIWLIIAAVNAGKR